MRYLSGAHDTKLRLSTKEKPALSYVEAGWGGEKKDSKSTNGYILPWVVGQ
jgi:hypothetical protein